MKKRVNPLSKIKLVYRPGKALIKVALLGVIVLSTAALVTIHTAIERSEAKEEAMRAQAAALEQQNQELEQENRDLQEKIDNVDTVQGVEDIAREELGPGDPNTIVIQPETE